MVVLNCSRRPSAMVDMSNIVCERKLLSPNHTEGAEKGNQQAELGPTHRLGLITQLSLTLWMNEIGAAGTEKFLDQLWLRLGLDQSTMNVKLRYYNTKLRLQGEDISTTGFESVSTAPFAATWASIRQPVIE